MHTNKQTNKQKTNKPTNDKSMLKQFNWTYITRELWPLALCY